MTKEELIKEAIKARDFSYSPYSNFKVGSALLTKDGRIFLGANIENASFPVTMCGERNATYNAYCHGIKKEDISAIAIVADTSVPCSPCGACRQVLAELLPEDAHIYLANLKGDIKETRIKDLLPYAFDASELKS